MALFALSSIGALVLLAGCGTPRSNSFSEPSQPRVALSELPPGQILITSTLQPASITLDPPNDRLEAAGEGAATSTRSVLNTPDLGNAQLEAVVGVIQFAAVPFAAAYGAVRAHQHCLSADQLRDSEADLRRWMSRNAASELLRDKVAEAAQQRTRRLLVCAGSDPIIATNQRPISAVLELRVEKFDLKASSSAQHQYTLRVETRARLRQHAGNEVLLDHEYSYESGPALFIDWASEAALNAVAQTAYQTIAEQIANDVFQPVSEPPLLIGPGQKHSRAPATPSRVSPVAHALAHHQIRLASSSKQRKAVGRVQLAHNTTPARMNLHGRRVLRCGFVQASAGVRAERVQLLRCVLPVRHRLWALEFTNTPAGVPDPAIAPTNPVPREAASIAIFTGQPDERLRSQPAAPDPGSRPGEMTDAEWKMDGLENDRNAVVQAAACLAAVPLGLWEQTVGAIGRRSREKASELARSLNEIPERTHFDGLLADQVARRLRSQVVNRVERTDEQPQIALTNPDHRREATDTQRPTRPGREIALEIQVVNVGLLPAHRRGKSMALCLDAVATVIRSSDGQELYCRPIRYRSSARRLKDWAASDVNALRQELDACSQTTAEALTRDLIARGFLVPGEPRPEASAL